MTLIDTSKLCFLHKGAGAVPAGHMAEICSTEEQPVKLKIYIEKLNGRFVGVLYKTLAIIWWFSVKLQDMEDSFHRLLCAAIEIQKSIYSNRAVMHLIKAVILWGLDLTLST